MEGKRPARASNKRIGDAGGDGGASRKQEELR